MAQMVPSTFSNVGSHGYPMDHRRSIGGSRISDTDEEDWC